MQQVVSKSYKRLVQDLEYIRPGMDASVENMMAAVRSTGRKVRVGFISKFFGLFEPHGLLLEIFTDEGIGTMVYPA